MLKNDRTCVESNELKKLIPIEITGQNGRKKFTALQNRNSLNFTYNSQSNKYATHTERAEDC